VSNRPKIDLAKLAGHLAGQLPGGDVRRPAAPARSARPAFPRIPLDRFEELLADPGPDDEARASADYARYRVHGMLDGGGLTIHYRGRPA